MTDLWPQVGPLKKNLHVRGGRGRGRGELGSYEFKRLWEARFVVIYEGLMLWEARFVVFYEGLRLWEARFVRVLRVGEALGGSDV